MGQLVIAMKNLLASAGFLSSIHTIVRRIGPRRSDQAVCAAAERLRPLARGVGRAQGLESSGTVCSDGANRVIESAPHAHAQLQTTCIIESQLLSRD